MQALAVVFPGQGSQRIGMLKSLASCYLLVEETFAEASEALKCDIWKLVNYGPISELNKTYLAQPIILTASVAIWRIWRSQGGYMPQIMAGHSLGEYSALVCSESIDLSVAVKLVMKRGILMQEAVPYGLGAMSIIIGLNENIVYKLCKIAEQGQVVAPACFNSLKNIVVAGHREAVDRVNNLCKNAGAKRVFVLPISVPSHCSLMKSIIEKFKRVLEKIIIRTPSIPIINNTDVCIKKNPQAIRDALIRQLYMPVRWYEIIQCFVHQQKILKCIEMGPGKILTGLMSGIVGNNIYSLSVNDPISLLKAIEID